MVKWTVAAAVLTLDTFVCKGDNSDQSIRDIKENSPRILEKRRQSPGVAPKRSRIDKVQGGEERPTIESSRLRSGRSRNIKPQQHPTECDPSLHHHEIPDVGILDCGVGEYCVESDASSLGGYCASPQDSHHNSRRSKWFSFVHPNFELLEECDPSQDVPDCDEEQECVEDPDSVTGGLCIDNAQKRRSNLFSSFQRQLQYYPYTLFSDFIDYACVYETEMCVCSTDAATGETKMSCSYSPPCVIDYVAPCLEESKVVDVCNSLQIDAVGTGPSSFEFNFCYSYTSPFTTEYCYNVVSDSGLLECTMNMDNEECISCDLDPENVCIQFDCTNTAFGTAGNLCEDRPLPDIAFVELLDCYGSCNICGDGGRISNYGYDISPQVDIFQDCYFTPICAQNELLCEDVATTALLGGLLASNTCKIAPDIDVYTTCCIETSSPVASPTPQQGPGCASYNFDCFSCIENDCYWCPGDALCSSTPEFQGDSDNIFAETVNSCTDPEDYTTDTCTDLDNFFSDPAFSAQKWIFDLINVQTAWEKGYRGKGVHVRVNDEGIEPDHPEFEDRIDAGASCSRQIQPPNSSYESGFSHGTAVASIVGAGADNDVCGVGIAPEVDLSSCFFNSQRTFANLFIYELDAIDISQNSWGRPACYEGGSFRRLQQSQCPFTYSESYVFPCLYCDFNNLERGDCIEAISQHCSVYFREDRIPCLEHLDLTLGGNCNFQTISEETEQAFETGVTEGRDGKGVIYVFASGNDLGSGADTNFEGVGTNTRFAISVGAVGKDGLVAYYSTSGASQFVTAPGGDMSTAVTNVVTANLNGGCSDAGQGTSFAAPVVSGVVALMLEANPELHWRDVQNIIATTSQSVQDDDLDHTDVVNGANIWHSNFYGFGIIDAAAAVEAAESWESVGPERNVTQSSPILNLPIPDDETQPIVSSIEVISVNEIRIESVYLYLRLEHSSRGHLQVKLTSPSGTESIVSPGRRPENTQISETGWWKMMTVAFWGESPNGEWTVSVVDLKDGDVTAQGSCASYEWLFADKITCSILERVEYCANGQVDPYNYAQAYGDYTSIFSFQHKGLTAEEACCACGGGLNDIGSLSDSLVEWKVTVFGEGSEDDEPVATPSPSASISDPPSTGVSDSPPTVSPTGALLDLEPTQPPTPILVPSPTSSPDPVVLTFNATGDTYLYRRTVNPLQSQPSPQEQTMLVRHGQNFTSDAFALIAFPDKDLTGSSFDTVSIEPALNTEIQIRLCLDHVLKTEAQNSSTYTMCRLTRESSTTDEGDFLDIEESAIEDLAGLRIPDDCMGTETDLLEFEVFPADERICLDISRLMKLSTATLEKRQAHPILFENEEKTLVFMIDSLGPEQMAGDRFFTMNSDKPPQLLFEQVAVDPNAPENNPTAPPMQVNTPSPSATSPSSNPTAESPNTTDNDDNGNGNDDNESSFNKNYLYSLLGLLVLCPLLGFLLLKAKNAKIENGDKQQIISYDTASSSGDQNGFPVSNVHIVSPQSVDEVHHQNDGIKGVDDNDGGEDDDDDESMSSESSGAWESELNDVDSDESSSESSAGEDTNDTFDDEAFSDGDDDILLRP